MRITLSTAWQAERNGDFLIPVPTRCCMQTPKSFMLSGASFTSTRAGWWRVHRVPVA